MTDDTITRLYHGLLRERAGLVRLLGLGLALGDEWGWDESANGSLERSFMEATASFLLRETETAEAEESPPRAPRDPFMRDCGDNCAQCKTGEYATADRPARWWHR